MPSGVAAACASRGRGAARERAAFTDRPESRVADHVVRPIRLCANVIRRAI